MDAKNQQQLDRLLANWEQGHLSNIEFVARLGGMFGPEEIEAIVNRIPPELVEEVILCAADNETLQPPESPFDQPFGRYFCTVGEALLGTGSARRRDLLSVICLPSFQAEWAMQLHGSARNGFSLALNIAETPIWPAQGTAVGAVRHEAPLPEKLAEALIRAWQTMLQRVRHHHIPRAGMDGVAYYFSCNGTASGRMAGTTWSPEGHTAPGRLVALSRLLYRFVEPNEAERNGLHGEILELAGWFNTGTAPNPSTQRKQVSKS